MRYFSTIFFFLCSYRVRLMIYLDIHIGHYWQKYTATLTMIYKIIFSRMRFIICVFHEIVCFGYDSAYDFSVQQKIAYKWALCVKCCWTVSKQKNYGCNWASKIYGIWWVLVMGDVVSKVPNVYFEPKFSLPLEIMLLSSRFFIWKRACHSDIMISFKYSMQSGVQH